MSGQFQTLCERKLIGSILSMHISYVENELLEDDFDSDVETEVEVNAFRCAIMLKIVGDEKRHWIQEDVKEFGDISPYLEQAIKLHQENNPRDTHNIDRFSDALKVYSSNAAKLKKASAPGLSIIAI